MENRKKNPDTTEYSFADTQWDVEGWKKEIDKVSAMKFDFMGGFSTLEKYDLPRDLDTLKGYGEYSDPSKWTRYILSLYQSYIGKIGYVPKSERYRIREEYLRVAQETAPFIKGLANAVAAGCLLKEEDGYIEVDNDKMLEDARPRFIRKIDVKRMSSYWKNVVASANAVKALKQFEDKNGLAPTMNISMHLNDPIVRRMIDGSVELDPNLFEQVIWRNFATQ